jgi:flagellar export protein FliJ
MSKFKFKFQSIANVKEILEKKILREISIINKEIINRKNERDIFIEERKEVLKDILKRKLKTSDYQSIKKYDEQLRKEIVHIEKEIESCLKRKELKQKELLVKKKEIKAFEILKENDYSNFLIEERKTELKTLNDIAIVNYNSD